MKNALHVIARSQGGAKREGLSSGEAPNEFISGCWVLSDEDIEALQDGYIYLHDKGTMRSIFGGRIVSTSSCERPDAAVKEGVAVHFVAMVEGRGVAWRGGPYRRAHSGVTPADLPHE